MKLELTTTVAVLTIIIMLRERCCTNRYGTDSLLQALLPAGVTVKDFVYGFTYKKSHDYSQWSSVTPLVAVHFVWDDGHFRRNGDRKQFKLLSICIRFF